MDLGRYLVEAHLLEGRPVAHLAKAHGVHRSWIYKLLARYRDVGEAGLVPRSRRPVTSPTKICDLYEDEIVALRKELLDGGFDAGAATIAFHLSQRHATVPSVSSIWRVLRARGFVTPQPHKRPTSSYVRFVAELPNEMWQTDICHVYLADDERPVEVINFIDDHSRFCLASVAQPVFGSRDVVRVFHQAAALHGLPQSVLSDNGAVYTASFRGGTGAMETELLALGVVFKHSRPYHPQTNGKVERFHQTMKKFLAAQDPAQTIAELQSQLDRFVEYYNQVRPHRSLGRKTPHSVFESRVKAKPAQPGIDVEGYRVRHDKVDGQGSVTLRYKGRLHHIGVGRPYKREHVVLLVAGAQVRILNADGQLIRELTIDSNRDYQPQE
jgi:transposase InsO family protein